VLWFSYLFYFVCLCNATIRGERKITIYDYSYISACLSIIHILLYSNLEKGEVRLVGNFKFNENITICIRRIVDNPR